MKQVRVIFLCATLLFFGGCAKPSLQCVEQLRHALEVEPDQETALHLTAMAVGVNRAIYAARAEPWWWPQFLSYSAFRHIDLPPRVVGVAYASNPVGELQTCRRILTVCPCG